MTRDKSVKEVVNLDPDDEGMVRITLRLPKELHERMKEPIAKRRSLNAEIIMRLERSFEQGELPKLSDPFAVLIGMMRGEIAKPEFDSLQRIYPEMGILMAELGVLRQGVELRRALEDALAKLNAQIDRLDEKSL